MNYHKTPNKKAQKYQMSALFKKKEYLCTID